MNRMKNVLIKVFIGLIIVLLAVVVLSCAINIYMYSYSDKYIVSDADDLDAAIGGSVQAVIVPGAYVFDNGRPCPMLEDRLLRGASVYNSMLAEKMLLSGDHGTKGYDEVNAMKTFILDMGVPKADVFLDHAGFSTYDCMIRAREIFEIESAVITTQGYHLTRAVYIARKSGIDAYGLESDLRRYPRSEMARYIFREWLARVKDFFYVNILRPEPEFLGEKIPITGSSTPSYDKPEDLN